MIYCASEGSSSTSNPWPAHSAADTTAMTSSRNSTALFASAACRPSSLLAIICVTAIFGSKIGGDHQEIHDCNQQNICPELIGGQQPRSNQRFQKERSKAHHRAGAGEHDPLPECRGWFCDLWLFAHPALRSRAALRSLRCSI